MKSTVFIITGMHRSGTSLTASLFQSVGVNIGENLVGPEYGNVRGHFEDIEFVELQKGILGSQGLDDLGSNVEITEIPVKKQYLKAAKRLIKNREESQDIEKKARAGKSWGWKDPRTTLFLNFWLELLPDAKFIFVYRSPWEVADSLYRRATDKKLSEKPEIAVKMWLNSNQRILDFYQSFSGQCLIAKVDSIGKNPEGFIQAVNDKFEVDLPTPPPGNFAESLLVKDIIKTSRPGLIEKYFPEALEVYQQLEKIGLGGRGESRFARTGAELVTNVRNDCQFWEFKDWLNIRGLEKQINLLETDVKKRQEFFREAQQKVDNLEKQLGETEQQLDSREIKLKESVKKLEALETEIGETQSLLDGKVTKLQESQTKVATLERKLGQTQAQFEGAKIKLDDSQKKVIRLEIALGQTQAQLSNSATRFQEALAKILSLETELGKTLVQLDGTQIKLTESQKKLLGLETELGQSLVELDRKKIRLQESQQKIEILETELGQTQQQLDGNLIKLQASQTKLQQLETEFGQTQQKLDATQIKLSESQNKIGILETEFGQTQQKLDATQIKLSESQNKIGILETEFGQTQQKLDATQIKLSESQNKIGILETEFGQTQQKLDATQIKLSESQNKIGILETEFGQTQQKLDATQIKLSESQNKIGILETDLGETQTTLEQTQAQLGQTQTTLEQTQAELGKTQTILGQTQTILGQTQTILEQTEINLGQTQAQLITQHYENETLKAEISAMKSSKFWKLREKWSGLKRKLSGLQMRLIFSIDSPGDFLRNAPQTRIAPTWNFASSQIEIVGWCFRNAGMDIQAIRGRVGEEIFVGNYHIERLDVAQKFPDISAAKNSGFQIPLQLSPGNYQLILEAQDKKGKWHKFASYPISVSTVEANFDAPTNWQQREGVILFAGWCCHPEQKITKLVLKCGDISVDCAYGLRRKDVGEVFPDLVGSSDSGFEATVELPPGKREVGLEAHLENGEIVGFPCSEVLKLRRYSFWEKAKDKLEKLSKFAKAIGKRTAERKQRLGRIIPLPSELPGIARQILQIYRQQQWQEGELLAPPGFVVPETVDVYDAWLAVNNWGDRSVEYLIARLEGCQTVLPKISVVMPVYNPPVEFLDKAIGSVLNQVYQNWEFCIADDCSSNPNIREFLTEIAETDSRIKLIFRSENGNISAATNSAAELATGDFILFLDNDDELTPDALGEVALYLSQNPETDFLYSDDDKINVEGKRFDPQFKPEYSPELLLSYMYMGHLCVVRREIFERVGGLRIGFEGSQDYDFALRATEISREVGHLPLVLYHWRTSPGSTAISGGEKPKSFLAGETAVQESLKRRGVEGDVYQPDWAVGEKLGIFKAIFPDEGASVSIIIPTKNKVILLKGCIESLKKTTYQNYQVFVIDNESDESETLEYLASLKGSFSGSANISVLSISNSGGKFNFAAINNRAVEQVDSEYILFLNNDTEVISPQWLSQMIGYAQFPGVGAVGAKLIYPDKRIQHAGVIHGLHHGLAGHAFKLLHSENRGYLSQASVSRNYSAVTAACMLTSRQLFLDLGGFDESNFAVAYNDADYGYRLLERGYRSVYCPDAELIHKEGTSRGYSDNPQEEANYRQKYSQMVDRFYSPHFSLESELFEIQPRRFFIKSQKSKVKSQNLEIQKLESQQLSSQKSKVKSQKLGARNQESGVRSQESESHNSQQELQINNPAKVGNSQNELEINSRAKVDESQQKSQINNPAKVNESQQESQINNPALETNSPNQPQTNSPAKFDESQQKSQINNLPRIGNFPKESQINNPALEVNSPNQPQINSPAKFDESQQKSQINNPALEVNSPNQPQINSPAKVGNSQNELEINSRAKVDESQQESQINNPALEVNSPNQPQINSPAKFDESQQKSQRNNPALEVNSPNQPQINSPAKVNEFQSESQINNPALETNSPNQPLINNPAKVGNSQNELEINSRAKVDESQQESQINNPALETNSPNQPQINSPAKFDESQQKSQINNPALEVNSPNQPLINNPAKVGNSQNELEINSRAKVDESQQESQINNPALETNSPNQPQISSPAKVGNSQNELEINSRAKVDESQQKSQINNPALETNSPNQPQINSRAKFDEYQQKSQINNPALETNSPNQPEINELVNYSEENLLAEMKDIFPKIKLLMCSNSLDLTGAPLHQLEIALKLADDGIVKPIIFSVNDGELREIYEQHNIQVVVLDNPLEHIYQRNIYDEALASFAKEIKALNIDVMYINTLENFFMVDVAQMLNIPSVWNVHESQPWQTYFNRFGTEIAARALECFRYPYRVIFVADATRNKYLPLNSHHNFTVVHNGLDLQLLKSAAQKWSKQSARSTLGVKNDEIVILLLGTVCERKGQHDLVKALSFIPETESQKIKCFLVGDRPNLYSLKLHELLTELPEEIQERVEIVKETPETAKYYQAADIFVCTSRIESFPRVILEAMAYDLPIITTPVFGIVEQVKPNVNGLFYTPDNPEELANVLTSLLIDEALRHRLAGNSKYVLESLNTFAEMTETYGQIFREAYFSLDKLAQRDYGTDVRIN
ncbi:glycosyltransferase [Okeania sp. SIO3B5]|uniref:glycosyltransferase n=1 Tax=Okeania sp. SIO3B5 TaxID=2607811 RepID=UPI0025D81B11|nr:glycosyltransferase [Okeania sp. SIO3B5]